MQEVWKDVVGFESRYMVSNMGNVYSKKTKKLLSPGKTGSGYLQVCCCVKMVPKHISVHRLVAEAFLPNELNKREVNHINGIKTDNRASNLEWATSQENSVHSWENGLQINKQKKPVEQILNGKAVATYESATEASSKTGINRSQICMVCIGKTGFKTAGGFSWRYTV